MSELLLCPDCHTPVQCRVKLAGVERIMPCLCQCGQIKRQKEKEQFREYQQQLEIRRLKTEGIQDCLLRDCSFESARPSPYLERAKRYVEKWEEVWEKNHGLLFWGAVGTGKSYLAACIANALIEQGVPALMTSLPKMLNQIGGMYPQERCRYLSSLSKYRLLVLDDFGIERSTEYALEQIFLIVDERYKSKQPLILTTNLTLMDFQNPADAAKARIYSRILEMCVPFRFEGADRRMEAANKKLHAVKKAINP